MDTQGKLLFRFEPISYDEAGKLGISLNKLHEAGYTLTDLFKKDISLPEENKQGIFGSLFSKLANQFVKDFKNPVIIEFEGNRKGVIDGSNLVPPLNQNNIKSLDVIEEKFKFHFAMEVSFTEIELTLKEEGKEEGKNEYKYRYTVGNTYTYREPVFLHTSPEILSSRGKGVFNLATNDIVWVLGVNNNNNLKIGVLEGKSAVPILAYLSVNNPEFKSWYRQVAIADFNANFQGTLWGVSIAATAIAIIAPVISGVSTALAASSAGASASVASVALSSFITALGTVAFYGLQGTMFLVTLSLIFPPHQLPSWDNLLLSFLLSGGVGGVVGLGSTFNGVCDVVKGITGTSGTVTLRNILNNALGINRLTEYFLGPSGASLAMRIPQGLIGRQISIQGFFGLGYIVNHFWGNETFGNIWRSLHITATIIGLGRGSIRTEGGRESMFFHIPKTIWQGGQVKMMAIGFFTVARSLTFIFHQYLEDKLGKTGAWLVDRFLELGIIFSLAAGYKGGLKRSGLDITIENQPLSALYINGFKNMLARPAQGFVNLLETMGNISLVLVEFNLIAKGIGIAVQGIAHLFGEGNYWSNLGKNVRDRENVRLSLNSGEYVKFRLAKFWYDIFGIDPERYKDFQTNQKPTFLVAFFKNIEQSAILGAAFGGVMYFVRPLFEPILQRIPLVSDMMRSLEVRCGDAIFPTFKKVGGRFGILKGLLNRFQTFFGEEYVKESLVADTILRIGFDKLPFRDTEAAKETLQEMITDIRGGIPSLSLWCTIKFNLEVGKTPKVYTNEGVSQELVNIINDVNGRNGGNINNINDLNTRLNSINLERVFALGFENRQTKRVNLIEVGGEDIRSALQIGVKEKELNLNKNLSAEIISTLGYVNNATSVPADPLTINTSTSFLAGILDKNEIVNLIQNGTLTIGNFNVPLFQNDPNLLSLNDALVERLRCDYSLREEVKRDLNLTSGIFNLDGLFFNTGDFLEKQQVIAYLESRIPKAIRDVEINYGDKVINIRVMVYKGDNLGIEGIRGAGGITASGKLFAAIAVRNGVTFDDLDNLLVHELGEALSHIVDLQGKSSHDFANDIASQYMTANKDRQQLYSWIRNPVNSGFSPVELGDYNGLPITISSITIPKKVIHPKSEIQAREAEVIKRLELEGRALRIEIFLTQLEMAEGNFWAGGNLQSLRLKLSTIERYLAFYNYYKTKPVDNPMSTPEVDKKVRGSSHNLTPIGQLISAIVNLFNPRVELGFLRVFLHTLGENFLQFLKNNFNRGSPLWKFVSAPLIFTISPFIALFSPAATRTSDGQIIWHINPLNLPEDVRKSIEVHESKPTEFAGLLAQARAFMSNHLSTPEVVKPMSTPEVGTTVSTPEVGKGGSELSKPSLFGRAIDWLINLPSRIIDKVYSGRSPPSWLNRLAVISKDKDFSLAPKSLRPILESLKGDNPTLLGHLIGFIFNDVAHMLAKVGNLFKFNRTENISATPKVNTTSTSAGTQINYVMNRREFIKIIALMVVSLSKIPFIGCTIDNINDPVIGDEGLAERLLDKEQLTPQLRSELKQKYSNIDWEKVYNDANKEIDKEYAQEAINWIRENNLPWLSSTKLILITENLDFQACAITKYGIIVINRNNILGEPPYQRFTHKVDTPRNRIIMSIAHEGTHNNQGEIINDIILAEKEAYIETYKAIEMLGYPITQINVQRWLADNIGVGDHNFDDFVTLQGKFNPTKFREEEIATEVNKLFEPLHIGINLFVEKVKSERGVEIDKEKVKYISNERIEGGYRIIFSTEIEGVVYVDSVEI
ncbi:MAG: hypothetical protein NC904_07780, partial [Candidatus Omnitrophica bacterium]|nr:hypothetical protein [Candidatus Omnitrophota bacterium]